MQFFLRLTTTFGLIVLSAGRLGMHAGRLRRLARDRGRE